MRTRRVRSRSLATAVLSVLVASVGLVAVAPAAFAATYDPAAPPYTFDANDLDTLSVYDATTGELVTQGSATAPLRSYYFLSSRDWNPDHTKASLFGYLAEDGKAQGAWSGQGLGPTTTYPATTAPAPVSEGATRPAARGDSQLTFAKLAASYPNNAPASSPFFQLYQVRVKTTFPAPNPSQGWASADIAIDPAAGTWRLLRPRATSGVETSTTLAVSPQSPVPAGTTETLTAQVTPATATGTVQFRDGTTALGAPVSVGSGTATTTTVLSTGSHTLTAAFVPADLGQFKPGTSNSVAYSVSVSANPPAQTVLVSADAGDRSATVTWGIPQSGGSAITSYTLTARSASATTVSSTVPVSGTTAGPDADTVRATLSGLVNGVEYAVTVNATNGIGDGPASEPLPVTPKVASVPGAPESVTATSADASAQVSWTAPTSDGGRPVLGYTVTATPESGPPLQVTVTGTSAMVTGLANGSSYAITVRATNDLGSGPASAPVTVVPRAITPPGAPQSLIVSADDSSASATWERPTSDGGSAITGYRITATTAGQDPVVKTSVGTSTLLTGLLNGVAYDVTVVAINDIGESARSSAVTVTPATVPSEPTAVTARAGNRSAAVTWKPPATDGGRPVTGYTVLATPVSTGAPVSVSSKGNAVTLTGLAAAVTYSVTVVATNDVGSGPVSRSAGVVPGPRLSTRTSLVAPAAVPHGRRFVLTGSVTGVPGLTRVVLRTAQDGRPAVDRSFTVRDGRLRLVLPAVRNTTYRLTFPGTAQRAPSSATRRLLVR